MHYLRQTSSLAALSLLALVNQASASGTRVGFKDAFATARGNAFVATADNPSALYYNAAGITQLEGTHLSANLYAVSLSTSYRGPLGSASLDEDPVPVPSLYATWKNADSPWAFGFATYAPFGLATEWPQNSALQPFATRNEQTVQTYNFSAARQVSSSLSLAASLTWNHLTTDLRRSPGLPVRFEGSGDAAGANLGALWRLNDQHQFGVSYSHHTRITADGTWQAGVKQSAEATFDFPEVAIAGWSYRPTPDWNLELNLDWTNWERLNTVNVRAPGGTTPLPFHWEPGLFYEFGVTRYFGAYHVSAGYCFTENSVPDASYTPAVPDSDRNFYSLGIGYRGERFGVDLAWQYADGGTRRVSGSPGLGPISADGSYRNRLQTLSLSVQCAF